MVTRSLIKPRAYFDSVKLMSLSAAAKALPGITQAVAIMGTERNKAALQASGQLLESVASARPDDLLIVVQGRDDRSVEAALERIEAMLTDEHQKAADQDQEHFPRSLGSALRLSPEANLALISVPGVYAAAETTKALRRGLNVLIFSNNVSLEDEIELKKMGRELGLLVMGPDCGTAMINGVPLAFANAVARGPIGIVGASGTGIQQTAVLIAGMGSGITHAIGTGGRDIHDAVGGITMLMGLDALDRDSDTMVILLISKPPGAGTANKMLERIKTCSKPVVVAFLGGDPAMARAAGAVWAATLEEAAAKAVALSRNQSAEDAVVAFPRADLTGLVADEVATKQTGQRFLRGLYAGGTLANEALLILEEYVGGVYSNIPLHPEFKLSDPGRSFRHSVIDLGDDEFTRGRPHPMIDPSYRGERLLVEASCPEVAVILCDVVIGYGSHPDPAGALSDAVRKARASAGRHLSVVASICGTADDPQNLALQEESLRREGILIFPSNAYAAEVAGQIARRCAEGSAV